MQGRCRADSVAWRALDDDAHIACAVLDQSLLCQVAVFTRVRAMAPGLVLQSCSFWCDGINGFFPHLSRKCAVVAIAKAPIEKLAPFRASKGWAFPLLSTGASTFGRDFAVEFPAEAVAARVPEYNYGRAVFMGVMPGISVFHKAPDGSLYHTYSTYARGLELFNGAWGFLDALPFGRAEASPMDWISHKEAY